MSASPYQRKNWMCSDHGVESVILRPDISHEDSQKLYKDWAECGTYDEVLGDPHKYAALHQLIEAVIEYTPEKNAFILDVGAGTGLTGQILQNNGYNNLHAIEPQYDQSKICGSKGYYHKVINECIGMETPLPIDDNTYDAIVSSGAMGPGCIPVSAIPEMIRLVKPGGHVIITMRHEFSWTVPAYKDKLFPYMDQMVTEGKWVEMKKKIYPNHFVNKDGVSLVYKIC